MIMYPVSLTRARSRRGGRTRIPRATFTAVLGPAQAATVTFNPRCAFCHKVVADYLAHPFSLECPRCGEVNQAGVAPPESAAARPPE